MPVWTVDYVGVLIAAVAAMIIGFVWYLPAVAGRTWSAATGITAEKMKANMGISTLVAGFVMVLLQATVLSAAITWSGANGIGEGVVVGLIVWLGLIVTTAGMNVLYEARPASLYWVYGGNSLVTFAVMAAILSWWGAR